MIFFYVEYENETLSIVHVDFSSMIVAECTSDDFEDFTPANPRGEECLLGEKITFKRLKANSVCKTNSSSMQKTIERCQCTLSDYVCSDCYAREPRTYDSDQKKKQECVWICSAEDNPILIPSDCEKGSKYNFTIQPYRKNKGSMCIQDLSNEELEVNVELECIEANIETTDLQTVDRGLVNTLVYLMLTALIISLVSTSACLIYMRKFGKSHM